MTSPIPADVEAPENHCKDCCCARSWTALGVTEYTDKSIPEHIASILAENKALREDAERLDWLESAHTLHRAVAFLYVVDGYEAIRTYDSNPVIAPYHGETLRAAIDAARRGSGG